MGDEVSRRTKYAFNAGLEQVRQRLDLSLEAEKEKNGFLTGVPGIVEAIRSGKIACRVYRKDKFHAKTYITHARMDVVGSSALVGSANFTHPGLTENIELNVQVTGQPVSVLQEWYEEHWNDAEDVSAEILKTIERHTQEYLPFDVYTKALQEFFRGHEMTAGEWEETRSKMFSNLDRYQKEAYWALMKIARQQGGAFLCDGVGLLGWDNRDTPLHLDDVAATLHQRLTWPENEQNAKRWREQWRSAFTLRHLEVISTSKDLAVRLADLARAIRDRIQNVLAI